VVRAPDAAPAPPKQGTGEATATTQEGKEATAAAVARTEGPVLAPGPAPLEQGAAAAVARQHEPAGAATVATPLMGWANGAVDASARTPVSAATATSPRGGGKSDDAAVLDYTVVDAPLRRGGLLDAPSVEARRSTMQCAAAAGAPVTVGPSASPPSSPPLSPLSSDRVQGGLGRLLPPHLGRRRLPHLQWRCLPFAPG
jgi:hypothetical protein